MCVTSVGHVEWRDNKTDGTYADVLNIPKPDQKFPYTQKDFSAYLPPIFKVDYSTSPPTVTKDPNTDITETLLLYKQADKTTGFNPPNASFNVPPRFWRASAADIKKLDTMIDKHTQARTRYVYVNKAEIEKLHTAGKIEEPMYIRAQNIVKNMCGKAWENVPDIFEFLDCGKPLPTFTHSGPAVKSQSQPFGMRRELRWGFDSRGVFSDGH